MMKTFWFRTSSPIALAMALLLANAAAAADFSELINRVPASANMIVLIDVVQLNKARPPAAVRRASGDDDAFNIPDGSRAMVLAAEFDFNGLRPLWEVAMATFDREPSFNRLAKEKNVTLEKIEGQPAVPVSHDEYVVRLSGRIAGRAYPASRQRLARWIRFCNRNKEPAFSSYLQGATDVASFDAPIVIATDLDGVFAKAGLYEHLEFCDSTKDSGLDFSAAAQTLSTIKGLTLAIRRDKPAYGKVRIDFGESPAKLAPVAKDFFLESLGYMGARIDDMETWKATAKGNALSIEGPLSRDGIRAILTLIGTPPAMRAEEPQGSNAEEGATADPRAIASASRRYYQSTVKLFDDIQRKRRSDHSQGEYALWIENYARKIDRLPILNVDQELLAWGGFVANSLRSVTAALRGIGIATGARAADINAGGGNGGYGGGYGYGGRYGNRRNNYSNQKARIKRKETAKGVSVREAQYSAIQSSISEMRIKMTNKYGIEF